LSDSLCSWLIALVFVASAVDKLVHLGGFVSALQSYVLVPPGFATYLAGPV